MDDRVIKRVVTLYTDHNNTMAEIAVITGYHRDTIAKALRAAGVKSRPRGKRRKPVNPEQDAMIVRLYDNGKGLTIAEIQAKAHLTFYTVRTTLARAGVKLKTGPRPKS